MLIALRRVFIVLTKIVRVVCKIWKLEHIGTMSSTSNLSKVFNLKLACLQVGLASRDLSPAHFDDVMSSIRILLDIVEQLRYDADNRMAQDSAGVGSDY